MQSSEEEYLRNVIASLSPIERAAVKRILEEQEQGNSDSINELIDAVYEYPRPPIDEFIFSPQFLDIKKSTIFPGVLDVIAAADDPTIREVFIAAGKGSGKSSISSVLMARATSDLLGYKDPSAYFGLMPDSKLAIVTMAISSPHAKLLFGKYEALIKRAPCFNPNKTPMFQVLNKEIRFPSKKFDVRSGHSGFYAFFGYDVYMGCIDEFSWFHDTEGNPKTEEVYKGIQAACKTRFPDSYKLVCISSPAAIDDSLMKRVIATKEQGTEVILVSGDEDPDMKDVKVVNI